MIRNTLQIVDTVQDDRHFRTVILQHIAVCNLDDIGTDAIFKMIDTTFQFFHLCGFFFVILIHKCQCFCQRFFTHVCHTGCCFHTVADSQTRLFQEADIQFFQFLLGLLNSCSALRMIFLDRHVSQLLQHFCKRKQYDGRCYIENTVNNCNSCRCRRISKEIKMYKSIDHIKYDHKQCGSDNIKIQMY